MNDFDFQLGFVIDSSWRLLEMQDRNPLSPSHGCFHYPYWRDKTSEFPDARFQEAGAALGLLSLPCFDDARAAGRLGDAETLGDAFAAGLKNWSTQQYADGSFDEWYKGERGFAAAEFTLIAYGLADRYMGELIGAQDRAVLVNTMGRGAEWLVGRHDLVKSNHEAAAAAALALAWKTTGEDKFRIAASDKLQHTLARQHAEGWFPEVGGMDLGYCSVLLDYVMIYVLIVGDDTPVPAMRRLFEFMLPHVQPDHTISPEAGLCLNPYVSRLGIGLLSQHDEGAAAAVASLRAATPGVEGLKPYLADDLRFARWAYLPVVAALEHDTYRAQGEGADTLIDRFPAGWTLHKDSAVLAFHKHPMHVYFSAAGGGVVRVYRGRKKVFEDFGLDLINGEGRWGSVGYDPDRDLREVPGGYILHCRLGKAAFFYPGFMARLILRLGCTIPSLSYLLRSIIDAYRLRKRTAINQSAAPLADKEGAYKFERGLFVEGDVVRVTDRLESPTARIDSRWLSPNVLLEGRRAARIGEHFEANWVSIEKKLSLSAEGADLSVVVKHG